VAGRSLIASCDVEGRWECPGAACHPAGGLGGSSELRLAVLVKDHGLVEAALQIVTAGLDVLELLTQAEDFLVVCLCLEVVAEGVGLSVDGLAAQAVFFGDASDSAVASEEGGGGAGDALAKG
jgi:hypothetical protein